MFAMQYSGTGIYSLNLTNGQSTLVTNYDSSIIGTIYTACCNFQSAPAPALSILVSNFSVATLRWPTSFPGYRLESADGLYGNAWSPVTNNPATNQGLFTVTTEGGHQRYFRLISP
jgi:hypothetical protein